MPCPPRATSSAAAFLTSSARPSAVVWAVSASTSRSAACSRSRSVPTSASASVASRCARSYAAAYSAADPSGTRSGSTPGERLLGLGAARERRVEGALLAFDGGLHRGESGCRGLRRAAQRGDPHVVLRDERALRGDVGVEGVEFGAGAHRHRGPPRSRHPAHRPSPAAISSISARASSIVACDTVVRLDEVVVLGLGEQREPLPGERVQPAQRAPARARGRRRPAAPRRRASERCCCLELLRCRSAGVVELVLQHEPLGVPLLLAAGVIGELGAQPDELVGEQSGLRIAHDGGDRRRLAGDLGLPAERLELAAQLAGEVAQPREVRLHGVELAEGLLLAPAVLEDAGGLLDEAAALLGRGLQHAVEAALADDDVHLAAEARVAQQLLHVQQPADVAVDRVLAGAVAEQRAADASPRRTRSAARHRLLSIVSCTSARPSGPRVAVPAKMTSSILPPRRVFAPCSPITQARASTTFDLPDPLGPTMHVTPGLEGESGRLGERLEPFERHALQVHAMRPPARSATAIRYRRRCSPAAQASRGRADAATRPSSAESARTLDARLRTALVSLSASEVERRSPMMHMNTFWNHHPSWRCVPCVRSGDRLLRRLPERSRSHRQLTAAGEDSARSGRDPPAPPLSRERIARTPCDRPPSCCGTTLPCRIPSGSGRPTRPGPGIHPPFGKRTIMNTLLAPQRLSGIPDTQRLTGRPPRTLARRSHRTPHRTAAAASGAPGHRGSHSIAKQHSRSHHTQAARAAREHGFAREALLAPRP